MIRPGHEPLSALFDIELYGAFGTEICTYSAPFTSEFIDVEHAVITADGVEPAQLPAASARLADVPVDNGLLSSRERDGPEYVVSDHEMEIGGIDVAVGSDDPPGKVDE
jgi:hypothetical protein